MKNKDTSYSNQSEQNSQKKISLSCGIWLRGTQKLKNWYLRKSKKIKDNLQENFWWGCVVFVLLILLVILLTPRKVRYNLELSTTEGLFTKTAEAKTQIKNVANQYNIPAEVIFAIAGQESSYGKFKIGDKGCSQGYFHINTCVFKEAKKIIGNVEEETKWVAKKLVEYGYTKNYKTLALAKYNAPANPNWEYAEKVKSRIEEAKKLLNK